jgi:hypothetical protein
VSGTQDAGAAGLDSGQMSASGEPAGVAEASGQRLPEFFVVGHAKSGTSALYEMLAAHPQIYMSPVKETWFFASELRAADRKRENPRHPDRLEVYLSLFAGAAPEQRTGEATPSYLFSHHAARRIAELQPQARIIALLREPASFLRSLHLQFLRTDVETEKDLRRAIELEPLRREGRALPPASTRPQSLQYSEHVRYVEQLERYRALFGEEQMLVLIYEDFRADNAGTVRRVLRFLDVDEHVPIAAVEKNPAVGTRAPRVQGLVRSLQMGSSPAARAGTAAIKAVTSQRLRRRAIGAQRRLARGKPRPPDERETLELRRRYKHEVVALGEYLDRDLVSFWGYEEI